MTLTKSDIAVALSEKLDLPQRKCADLVDLTLDLIKKTLRDGEDVLITGFGKFCMKGKKARSGRNPLTGEHLVLDGRRVVTFACSGVLKRKINGE
jgi:integration host factor subunit alpha